LRDGAKSCRTAIRVCQDCNDQRQAFEWSVDVRQSTIFGNDSAGPVAALITCDGKFQTVEALVPGANGPYSAGTADVQGAGSALRRRPGSDVELEDRDVVRLRP